jgi:MFS family permease
MWQAIRARARVARTSFAQPQLRRLELAWLGFNLGEYAVTIALVVYAFEQGGATAVGIMTLARTLPAVLSAPLFSVLTDRLNRHTVLAIGFWGRAGATGLIVAALVADAPAAVVYLLAALDIILSSAVFPASAALIPDLSNRPEELGSANAVFTTMANAGVLLGPLLAAGVIAASGVAPVFMVAVLIYALGALATRNLVTDRTLQPLQGLRLMDEFKAGLGTLRQHWDSRTVVLTWTLESLLVGVVDVVVVVVALELLGWGDPGVGLLAAAIGIGGVAGAISSASDSRTRAYGRAMVVAILLIALGLAGAAVPLVIVVVLGMVLIGFVQAQADFAGQTLVQRTTPSHSLGRVLGLFEGFYWAAIGIGALGASLVIEWLGIVPALVVFAGAGTVIALLLYRPMRRIDSEADTAQESVGVFADCSLFTALPIPTLEYLAKHSRTQDFAPGERIIVEGERGDDFFVIVAGEVIVTVDGKELNKLGPGDYFGEIAVLYDAPRSATVTATTELIVLSLDGPRFVAAVTGYMGSSGMVATVAETRLAENRRLRETP